MRKNSQYKLLIIGLFIIPIIFILLVTIIGIIINFLKYNDFNFNWISYWKNSLNNWFINLISFLLSITNYFYFVYKVCFFTKQEAKLKPTKQIDYGNAKWLTKKEINQLYPLVNSNTINNQHGFVVSSKIIKNVLFYNLKTGTHSLVIGGTGSGKTQGLVLPTININAKSKIKPSMVITDIKGELYQSQRKILQEENYDVKILNLRKITESITWNPLKIIYDQFKLMLLTNNKQMKLQLKVQIQSDIQDLSKTLFINEKQIDSFWNDSSALIIEAIILGILEKTEILINNNIDDSKITEKILEKYLPVNRFNLASVTVIASLGKDMINWFKSFPDTSVAKLTANHLLQSGSKTLINILMTISTKLSLFKNDFIRNLTCQNDLDFQDFINKPVALFIVIPDESSNYYLFISLLISQLYKFLVQYSNKNNNGKLIKPVYFLCDEFGNIPAISNIETIITIARSRNIFFQLILQNLQQLKEKYGKEKSDIIFANCSLHIFLQTMDLDTAEKYSKILGDTTVTQVSINKKNKSTSCLENLKKHPLILPSDLMKLSANQVIVFYSKINPFKNSLIPWYQINSNNIDLVSNKKDLELINFQKDYLYDIKKQF